MFFPLVLLYGGPDTILPVASTLAAIGGLLLILWNQMLTLVRRIVKSLRHRSPNTPNQHPPSAPLPHATGRERT